jgi:hypothetical protein
MTWCVFDEQNDTVVWKDLGLTGGVIYKSVGVNHWGYKGPPSNEVMITWGASPE